MPNPATNQTKKKAPIERAVHTLDATDVILGRLATQAATLLRGKHKVQFVDNLDCGDHVYITNARAIKTTGTKLKDKIYYRHSGHLGGLKEMTLGTLLDKSPEKVIERAVYGMLPKNRLRAGWMRRLHVYAGEQK